MEVPFSAKTSNKNSSIQSDAPQRPASGRNRTLSLITAYYIRMIVSVPPLTLLGLSSKSDALNGDGEELTEFWMRGNN